MKKIIFGCFLIFSIFHSAFALQPPDLTKTPYQPILLGRQENALIRQKIDQNGLIVSLGVDSFLGIEQAGKKIHFDEVISLAGYNVEYGRIIERGSQSDLLHTVGNILRGRKNTLVLLPVPRLDPVPYGLNTGLINVLKKDPKIVDPSNQIAMVVSRDRILQDLPKVPEGVFAVFIYPRKPGQANSGTNQLLIEAANRGLGVEEDVLGGGAEVYKDVIGLLPHAASQIREGINPIQLNLYPFKPTKDEENDGWNAGLFLPQIVSKHPSLRIPQVSFQPFRTKYSRSKRDFEFVKDKKWLDFNRNFSSNFSIFELSADIAAQIAENSSRKFPPLDERTYAAYAYAEEVAFKVLKETIDSSGPLTHFGSLEFAVRSIEMDVINIREDLDRYEAVRGERVK